MHDSYGIFCIENILVKADTLMKQNSINIPELQRNNFWAIKYSSVKTGLVKNGLVMPYAENKTIAVCVSI